MENKKTIEAIIDFIVTAEKSIKNAKKLLKDLANNNEIKLDVEVDLSTKWLESYTDKEAKIILSYVPATFVLFITGLAFGFFFITPTLLNVLLSLGENLFNVQLTADSYLAFVLHTSLPLGVIFELPVIVAFLTSLHIITPKFLIKNRRYGYFLLLVLAVVLTPADFISDLTMTVPLILLYEISVLISKYIYNKRR